VSIVKIQGFRKTTLCDSKPWHGIWCQPINFLHFVYLGLFQKATSIELWWFMFTNLEQPICWFRIMNNFSLLKVIDILILKVKNVKIFAIFMILCFPIRKNKFFNHSSIRHSIDCLTPKERSPFFGPFLRFGQAIVDAIFVQKISNFWWTCGLVLVSRCTNFYKIPNSSLGAMPQKQNYFKVRATRAAKKLFILELFWVGFFS
jgi:hypothetical protein